MAAESRVQQLLDAISDSGCTPEAVCGDCPELLPEVRRRWLQICAVEAELDALFPTPGHDPGAVAEAPVPWQTGAELPRVPGYEVEALLGRGGMGIVYKARHLRLNRRVALKMLITGAYAGQQERARFQHEAEAVAGLHHAHIVQVYDVGEHQGWPYFTMELLEGGSLAQALAGTPQPAGRAAELLIALAEAMQVAHRGGIVHRDLKPANILLAAEGTPKVADFGLARHFDGEPTMTLSGTRIGTPSYMAPEQVTGKAGTIGPATDIYALGALLYEMLTGRPPFRGETAAETERQVINDEPVAPSRLNTKVPRDLETICLKCLAKEPQRRYAGAAALAEDLRRFEEGRPIQARPVGWGGRLWRWGRRKPTAAALLVTALALAGLSVGGGFWLERQQAERRAETARREGRQSKAAEAVLEQSAALQKKGRWPEARVVLEGAPSLVDTPALADLRERVAQALADAQMVTELEEIRLSLLEGRAPSGNLLYAEAFREYGIALPEPEVAAAQIRNSAIRETLLAFLHDWLLFWASDADKDRLRAMLDRADDDDWRRRLRKTLGGTYDHGERMDLLRARQAPDQPPLILGGLAYAILNRGVEGEEARALVRAAQQRHPDEFWINYHLGYILLKERPQEAIGYFRAAVAGRPDSSQAHIMLGRALHDAGDTDGAVAAFRTAIPFASNLAVARDLARALARRGGLEEARGLWAKQLEASPPAYDPWDGYAPLCAFLRNEEAYRWALTALLERPRDRTDHWATVERDSLACLLLPASGEDLRRAVALVARALTTGPRYFPDNAYTLFISGLAEYRQGRPQQAVPLLEESAALLPNRAGPRLVLAMAQFRSGGPGESRQTLAAAVRAYNWMESQADHPTAWVSHVLRREAEALILKDLPAFLRGEYEPQHNDERLALVGVCQSQGRYHTAARLYAEAFAADPDLADNLTTESRYRSTREEPFYERVESVNTEARYLAARCATLAGCGLARDGAGLSRAERARWRKQARAWLRDDLALWGKTLARGSDQDLALARRMLTHWQVEPDLAGIRDLKALDEASTRERDECFALWDEVGAVLRRIAVQERARLLDPKRADPRWALPTDLLRQGRLEEARVAWRAILEGNPLDHNAWFGYAELCLFLGREDEYLLARQDLLARFFITDNPYFAERTGRACLLMPAMGDELRQAVALTRRAAASDPSNDPASYPWFLFARGLAEFRQGKLDQAIVTMRGDASRLDRPIARLVLAMALHRDGRLVEARKTLAAAILSYDWRAAQARDHDAWICHVLRREAEAMILPNLPAFLEGTYRPQDNHERLALLGVCQFTSRTGAAARLYADAFATDARLAEDLRAGHRSNAARAAALAGCGLGEDGAKLSMAERTIWRRQARDWLRADLAACARSLESRSEESRVLVKKVLAKWKSDPDLAGLREPSAMDRLSAGERDECQSLWQAVDHVLRRAREVP
jgi:serine/threonine-protein kinase